MPRIHVPPGSRDVTEVGRALSLIGELWTCPQGRNLKGVINIRRWMSNVTR
jgi:hypothetical protein